MNGNEWGSLEHRRQIGVFVLFIEFSLKEEENFVNQEVPELLKKYMSLFWNSPPLASIYLHFYPSCQLNLGVASWECVGYNFERDSQNIFLFS